jgi:hypothetical protein
MGLPLLCLVEGPLWGGVINAQIGWLEAHVQEIFSAGEMAGAGLGGEPRALLQKVGEILRGEGLIDKGVLQNPKCFQKGFAVE